MDIALIMIILYVYYDYIIYMLTHKTIYTYEIHFNDKDKITISMDSPSIILNLHVLVTIIGDYIPDRNRYIDPNDYNDYYGCIMPILHTIVLVTALYIH